MRFTSLLPTCLLLALASASPDDEDNLLNDLVEDEIHVFKRDALITPRDVELAQRDGIDLDEMYRHSVIKRDDGDHVTIWVAKSYNESSSEQDDPDKDGLDPKLAARSKLRIGSADNWSSTSHPSQCIMSRTNYIGDTGPNAPFTGGVDTIVRWGGSCDGWWWLGGHNVVQNLIVAGSDSGFNVRFTVQGIRDLPSTTDRRVGCRDVRNIAQSAKSRFERNVGNAWRVRARGDTICNTYTTVCYKDYCHEVRGDTRVNWWLDNWNRPVF